MVARRQVHRGEPGHRHLPDGQAAVVSSRLWVGLSADPARTPDDQSQDPRRGIQSRRPLRLVRGAVRRLALQRDLSPVPDWVLRPGNRDDDPAVQPIRVRVPPGGVPRRQVADLWVPARSKHRAPAKESRDRRGKLARVPDSARRHRVARDARRLARLCLHARFPGGHHLLRRRDLAGPGR